MKMRKYIAVGRIPVCFIFVMSVICGMASGQYGGSPPPPESTPTNNSSLTYRMVNLTSQWNFMDVGWRGYSRKASNPEADQDNSLYPYPYWDFEKQYLLAKVRQLRKQGVNSIRILASRPWELCEDAIIKQTDENVRNQWWSPNNGGDMQTPFIEGTFHNTEYMNGHWQSNLNSDDYKRLVDIQNCWDRLFELLLDLRDNFTDPVVHVDISFTLGWSLKGPLPITIDYKDYNGTLLFTQTFNQYFSGTNWLYFKTFYDACKRCINNIPPNNRPSSVNDLLINYLHVNFVETSNELDSTVMKFDVNPRFLYSQPWDRDAIPEYYYETNDELGSAADDSEKLSKRSVEKFRQLIDWANMVVHLPQYLGISWEKITYGFANPETMRLLTLSKDANHNDQYMYNTLSWHMYGSLFSIGLGPTVDWVRSSMNNFPSYYQNSYQILIGEMGHIFDYQLSDYGGSFDPYPPFDDPNNPTVNPAVYDSYDSSSGIGYYYTQRWLKEAEHFAQSPHENIWLPTGPIICPIVGVGLWASSDLHLITDYSSSVWRWGLLETFDTPYRKREHQDLRANYGYPSRAKKFIIAPIGRYVLQAVTECWQQSPGDPFPTTWHSGDLVQHPFYISCGLSYQLDGTINMQGYTPSYDPPDIPGDISNMPPLPFAITNMPNNPTNGGPDTADIWFYTKYYANLYGSDIVRYWWGGCQYNNQQAENIVAIFSKSPTSSEWQLKNYTHSTGYNAETFMLIPSESDDKDILLYLWTSDKNCSYMFQLVMEKYTPPDPKEP